MRLTFKIYTDMVSYHDENGWHDITGRYDLVHAKSDMYCLSYIELDEDGIICSTGQEDFSIERMRMLENKFFEVVVRYPETRTDVQRKTYSEHVAFESFYITKNRPLTKRDTIRAWKHYVRDNLLPKHYYEDIMDGIGELEFR